jgi:hypothetical protein
MHTGISPVVVQVKHLKIRLGEADVQIHNLLVRIIKPEQNPYRDREALTKLLSLKEGNQAEK